MPIFSKVLSNCTRAIGLIVRIETFRLGVVYVAVFPRYSTGCSLGSRNSAGQTTRSGRSFPDWRSLKIGIVGAVGVGDRKVAQPAEASATNRVAKTSRVLGFSVTRSLRLNRTRGARP